MVGFGKSGQQDENVLPAVCIPKTAPFWTQGSQSELSLLKPLEKSVEIKKRNRGKKKTFLLAIPPKASFPHPRPACVEAVYSPGTCGFFCRVEIPSG